MRLGSGLGALCLGLVVRSLRGDSQSSETSGVMRGDVREDLTVELDTSLLEARDEHGIADPVQAASCADTNDPERAKLTLLLLTSDVGELETALNGFLSSLIELGFCEEVTTRALEDLFASITAFCSTFYAWHRALLLRTSVVSGWR